MQSVDTVCPSPSFPWGSSPDTMKQLSLKPPLTAFGDRVHVNITHIRRGGGQDFIPFFMVFMDHMCIPRFQSGCPVCFPKPKSASPTMFVRRTISTFGRAVQCLAPQ